MNGIHPDVTSAIPEGVDDMTVKTVGKEIANGTAIGTTTGIAIEADTGAEMTGAVTGLAETAERGRMIASIGIGTLIARPQGHP
mmetsp:Transcript_13798/g.16627  ORF Transcript_13798/g.16627 Transcript_13798/m.16627 type:complete len:84 (+) Transcript_13798:3-254(+)